MPLFQWISTSGTAATTAVPPWFDAATGTATQSTIALYHAMQNAQQMASLYNSGWALNNTTTSSAVTNTIYWVGGDQYVDQQTYVALAQGRVYLHQARTEEQRLELQRRQQERAEAVLMMQEREAAIRAQSVADRHAALGRSRELLLSHLSKEQAKTFEKKKFFVVIGGKTKKTYRINTASYTRNIEEMDGERPVYRLCGHLRYDLPLHDHHVAQKISLEYDEEAFLRLCNRAAA